MKTYSFEHPPMHVLTHCKNKVYLDHASTTPLRQNVKNYIIQCLDIFGNPSSLHQEGDKAKKIISDARIAVADFINARPDDIYFTSGGSASNSLAIKGCIHIFCSPTVHKSILECIGSCHKHYLKTDRHGLINADKMESSISIAGKKPFVIIDYANSEIGTIQNVKEIIDIVHFYNGIVYLDCTGSIPAIPLDVKALHADMCGFSAHKLGGLKGCGVLYKRAGIKLEPLIYGSQEQGLIGGTENVLGIASLGKAVEDYDYSSITSRNRDYVHDYMIRHIPDCYLVGSPINSGNRLPHNLYMCFKGIEGESLMLFLDINGIQVSTGSACNSRNIEPSPTLSAIGMDKNDIHSCIRLTFSGRESQAELDYVCAKITECVAGLRNLPC